MSNGFSLISINGKISEPATVLIKKISDAIGGYYKPRQIRRVAEAKADAEIIEAESKIEVTDLQRRALARFISEEAKKQENIESIIVKAIPELLDTSNPQDMDDDWVMNFFDKCRIISDSEMQLIWSKILASEANGPGNYSKRTVNLLGSLSKSDALLFTNLCGFTVRIRLLELFIFDEKESIYKDKHVTFDNLIHLDDIGLITFSSTGYTIPNLSQEIEMNYFGTILRLRFNEPKENTLTIGKALFTQSGNELSSVCNPEPVEGFIAYCIEKITKQGITCTR